MTYTTLELTFDGPVGQLRMNRPEKANAMNLAFWTEFPQALDEASRHAPLRALVISGAGRHFSSGIDIEALVHLASITGGKGCPARASEKVHSFVQHAQAAFNAIEQLRVPVIAAVHGACVGGAVDLIAACDIRICSRDARFCIKEVDLAVVPDVGTLQRLRHVIGLGHLADLTYTAETFDVTLAERIGLVTRVFADAEQLRVGATAMAQMIAAKSPVTTRGIKRNLLFARDHSVADGLAYTAAWNAGMLMSADSGEAMAAQMAKRSPKFED